MNDTPTAIKMRWATMGGVSLTAAVTSIPSPLPAHLAKRRRRDRRRRRQLTLAGLLLCGGLMLRSLPDQSLHRLQQAIWIGHPQPLMMKGGDPYIRALMRTISAAESNTREPYRVLYGGRSFQSLRQHPNICVDIVTGPNVGQCTTAAGRYQFLTETWREKAQRYHPHPPSWHRIWGDYSFDPESQDWVVYQWLKDPGAWDLDIGTTLRQGELDRVLKRLSGTWTSLGYGIESNTMTARLPRLYQDLLQEELENVSSSSLPLR
ncbi:MAG: glycoside hydrolase [Nodosilinea sp.]